MILSTPAPKVGLAEEYAQYKALSESKAHKDKGTYPPLTFPDFKDRYDALGHDFHRQLEIDYCEFAATQAPKRPGPSAAALFLEELLRKRGAGRSQQL